MRVGSKTGLLASPKKKIIFPKKKTEIHLKAIAKPAPFVLKPYAGIYNPYSYGCSLLCNHPTDNDAKELLKRAKDSWVTEGRSLLLAEEVAAIKASLEKLQTVETLSPRKLNIPLPVESIPEELFRKYTETDSRPLTPAPTIASAYTRASGSRRCVTPDPIPTEIKEKTLLILDLRRSHSQETLSWQGSSHVITQEPPLIKIQHAPISPPANGMCVNYSAPQTADFSKKRLVQSPKRPKSENVKPTHLEVAKPVVEQVEQSHVGAGEEEEIDRRRGKRRKKRARDSSIGPPAFQTSIDPETQIATTGFDSTNASARPSIVNAETEEQKELLIEKPPDKLDIDSFLDKDILKHLRRELDMETIDNEFNIKRKIALIEALKTVDPEKKCEDVVRLQKEIDIRPLKTEMWLNLPRDFSRSSARFELPMNSDSLTKMTPMDYIKKHATVSKTRKLLYNCIFNKYKIEYEEIEKEQNTQRKMEAQNLPLALGTMMGKELTAEQLEEFHDLVGWSNEEELDFKTFCGICALCERLMASQFCPQVASKTVDPCHEIETVDFEALPRKLHGQNVDPRLKTILYAIRDL